MGWSGWTLGVDSPLSPLSPVRRWMTFWCEMERSTQKSRALDILLLLRNDVIDNGFISVNCHVQSGLLSKLQQLILRRVQHRLAQRVIHDR